MKLVDSGNARVIALASRVVGNFVYGNEDEQIQTVIDDGVLRVALKAINSPKKELRKEMCLLLSYIAGGTQKQVQTLTAAEHAVSPRSRIGDQISLLRNSVLLCVWRYRQIGSTSTVYRQRGVRESSRYYRSVLGGEEEEEDENLSNGLLYASLAKIKFRLSEQLQLVPQRHRVLWKLIGCTVQRRM